MPSSPQPLSTDPANTAARQDARLDALEVKASFSEDTLDRLNDVVVRQQQQIDRLVHEVALLRQQQSAAPDAGAFRSLRDELPPHY